MFFLFTFAGEIIQNHSETMTYEEAIQYLYTSQPPFHLVGAAAYKPGLDNTIALMEHTGNPHRLFRSIHIAGTNGKGSVSHLIAASLQAAGLKTGLYTSPHLVDFRERIRINGQMIPRKEVARFLEENKHFLDAVRPSFFETTMALAFCYFAKEEVDIAVVETGLGGRLDSTNILSPLLTVITNIGLDHTEFLGNTLPEIATEKAGIMKPGTPCIIGETDPLTAPVFLKKAEECGILGEGLETTCCRLWFADQCNYLNLTRRREITDCQLKGNYQEKNKQTAYVALRALRNTFPTLDQAAIRKGFAEVCTLTGLRGRWETLQDKPLTICDTGHNSHGLKYVAASLIKLQEERPQSRLRIVFGMVDDKDVERVLRLMPRRATYYFAAAATHRAIPAEKMQQMWQHAAQDTGFATDSKCCTSVTDAVRQAQKEAADEDIIFIGGSNYVVGEALTLF